MLYPNIITSDLEEKLEKIVEGKDMALVLSSLKEIIHGYYSTEKPRIMTSIPYIRYNNEDISVTSIAKIMGEKDYASKIIDLNLIPFSFFRSLYPNKQELDFKLIITGDIKWGEIQKIADILEKEWKKNTTYSLNLELEKQVGKI